MRLLGVGLNLGDQLLRVGQRLEFLDACLGGLDVDIELEFVLREQLAPQLVQFVRHRGECPLGFIGTLASFGKILLRQLDARIDQQNDRVSKLENQLNETLTKLPLEYQRREDAIRFETVLNAKLDAIGARIERLMEKS